MTARWMTRWKPAVGLESLAAVGDQVGELGVDVFDEVAAQHLEIDVAGAHDRRRVLVVDQGEQQVLERGVFVPPLAGEGEGAMEGLFEAARKARQGGPYWSGCLLLFHNALQRMLVLAGEIHHLRHFGLGHLIGEHAALADAVVVDVQHDAGRVLARPC